MSRVECLETIFRSLIFLMQIKYVCTCRIKTVSTTPPVYIVKDPLCFLAMSMRTAVVALFAKLKVALKTLQEGFQSFQNRLGTEFKGINFRGIWGCQVLRIYLIDNVYAARGIALHVERRRSPTTSSSTD